MLKSALQTVGIIKPAQQPADRFARELHLRAATLNGGARTVEAVIATESQATSFNLRTGELVLEVYLADGFVQPKSKQVPLLDTHRRESTLHIRGSVRRFRVQAGAVVGTLHFGASKEAETDFINVRDGHLTDVSGGFLPMKTTRVRRGESATVMGRKHTAPPDRDLYVHTRWTVREVSLTAIGSDPGAVLRAARRQAHPTGAAPAPTLGRAEAEAVRREAVAIESNRLAAIRSLDPSGRHPILLEQHLADPAKTAEHFALAIMRRERGVRMHHDLRH